MASSVRFSEDSLEPDGHNTPFGGGVAAASSWFDKVFSGMSFGLPDRYLAGRLGGLVRVPVNLLSFWSWVRVPANESFSHFRSWKN